MKIYKNIATGEVLVRRKSDKGNGAHRVELRPALPLRAIGYIYFRVNEAASELEVFDLNVSNHVNAATATSNPHPGVGRLLMCIACWFGQKRGATEVQLASTAATLGFYTRMGFHADRRAARPVDGGGPFVNGQLDPQWMGEFDRNFRRTRTGIHHQLKSSIESVLINIQPHINDGWIERKISICSIM